MKKKTVKSRLLKRLIKKKMQIQELAKKRKVDSTSSNIRYSIEESIQEKKKSLADLIIIKK